MFIFTVALGVRSLWAVAAAVVGRLLLVMMLLAALLGLAPARPADALGGLVVKSLSDASHGSFCGGSCTLRDAISAANLNPGPATISFSAGISGTIVLTSTLPNIGNDITIDGSGTAITVSGNGSLRVLFVPVTATLHLQSITIAWSRSTAHFSTLLWTCFPAPLPKPNVTLSRHSAFQDWYLPILCRSPIRRCFRMAVQTKSFQIVQFI